MEEDIKVLAVDVESRHDDPKMAFDKVFAIAKSAFEHGVRYVYKKTDSTLRGNIAANFTRCFPPRKAIF